MVVHKWSSDDVLDAYLIPGDRLTPSCNLKLHFPVFYDFPHKTEKKITETAVTLLIRKISKKRCEKSYIIKVQRIQKVYQI